MSDTPFVGLSPDPEPAPLPHPVPETDSLWVPPENGPRGWVLPATWVVGVFIAITWVPNRPGLQWMIAAIGVGAFLFASMRADRTVEDLIALGLGVALLSVPVITDNQLLIALCLLAAVGTLSVTVFGARNWAGTLLAPVAMMGAWVMSLNWWRAPRISSLGTVRVSSSWLRGGAIAVVLVAFFSALLASADPRFAEVLGALTPELSLDWLWLRVVAFALTVILLGTWAFAAGSTVRWERFSPRPRAQPPAVWVIPLIAVDLLLLVFGVLQWDLLFSRYDARMFEADLSYADRVHQGFGQLVVVTLSTLILLAWAGWRTDREQPKHRAVLLGAGGTLVLLALGVVASALRRLWLYEQAYGWTVLRLEVGVFEIWLGAVLVAVALFWLVGRGPSVARIVLLSAAGVLVVLALVRPDALVARWNIDRLQDPRWNTDRTQSAEKVDVEYLRGLSADAVPDLACLPEPYRSEVLDGWQVGNDPVFAVNLSRVRARDALAAAAAGHPCRPGQAPALRSATAACRSFSEVVTSRSSHCTASVAVQPFASPPRSQ